jgi:ribonuclease HI
VPFALAKTDCFTPICEVHVSEALGLLSALKWVHEFNLGPIEFELDSKKVVWIASVHQNMEFETIIKHCQLIFSSTYVNSSIEFVTRQTNKVDHNLARAATFTSSFQKPKFNSRVYLHNK